MSSVAFAVPGKSPDAFRTISEVAAELDVPQHVLRFWESRFVQIRPVKRAGGRRFYRPEDVDLLRGIRSLLYGEGFTIRGVQKVLKDRGLRHVAWIGRGVSVPPEPPAVETPVVVEKIVFVETAAAPVKKRAGHLRAVPAPMSLPFFNEASSFKQAADETATVQAETGLAQEERRKLTQILDELEGLKKKLRATRR